MSAKKDLSPTQRARALELLRKGMALQGVAASLGMSRKSLFDRRREDPTLEAEFQRAIASWEERQLDTLNADGEDAADMDQRRFALECLTKRKPWSYGALVGKMGNLELHIDDEQDAAQPAPTDALEVAIDALLEARKAGKL